MGQSVEDHPLLSWAAAHSGIFAGNWNVAQRERGESDLGTRLGFHEVSFPGIHERGHPPPGLNLRRTCRRRGSASTAPGRLDRPW